MIFGSVCSGIEAASVAWHPLGWRASFVSEIEAFPRAVLSHRWPDTPLHGDFTTIEAGQYEPIDLLVGGTPCQSFSVAGLRGGLADDRGNLALEFLRLADRLRPRWLVWENVPGVLSSAGGRDFGSILGGMVELGYGVAYRVLDAQFFGVAQRRRRVFVVGYLGDWRRAAAVLFERACLSGDPAPRREKGEGVAPTISARPTGGGGLGTDFDCDGGCVVTAPTMRAGGNKTGGDRPYGTDVDTCDSLVVAFAIQERAVCENPDAGPDGAGWRGDGAAYTLEARTVPQAVAFDTTQITSAANFSNPKPGDPCHPLAAGAHPPAVAWSIMPQNSGKDYKARAVDVAQPLMAGGPTTGNQGGDFIVQQPCAFALRGREGGSQPEIHGEGDSVGTLRAGHGGASRDFVAFAQNQRDEVRVMDVAGALAAEPGAKQQTYISTSAVRRLTPLECERLQGFPDGYTAIPWRGRPADQCPDGPRYKALGNSMAVPVMRWIGERIAMVEALS